jgi:hypothetical protein
MQGGTVLMKKFLALMLILILTTLSACGRETSAGLEYKSNNDGTCSVVSIGKCPDTMIIIPEKNKEGDTVVWIGEAAFKRATGVTAITLPETVTVIGDYAFCENKALAQVNIPKSVYSLGRSAFYKCTKLGIVELEEDFKYAIIYRSTDTEEVEVALGKGQLIDDMGEEIVYITDENRDEIYKMVFGNAELLYK